MDNFFVCIVSIPYIISFQSTSMAETETAAWLTGNTQSVFTEALMSSGVQEERKEATEKIARKERPGIIIKYEILLKL